ncbi:MAG: hypothetical protein MK111_21830 [Crocosphaera sp.]|uniref:Uncharacterized protein n=2 Tax=Crocosphaera watsonii TaxID=263511 RepID=T2JTZ3_CROWT|nr:MULTISPECIES: hypothetical protein [Crocosphaera]MCH2247233.1 hypothetical protein [Crocosphaera sp.]CCQ54930.1 hypothetical protein CWATWH0005_2834 [Crocosphaera watsonii WH 0005]CCQ68544.1 hypothetical protein CWATWH0402_4286 [Crocosphaera watsonii WH 0402]
MNDRRFKGFVFGVIRGSNHSHDIIDKSGFGRRSALEKALFALLGTLAVT